MKKHRKICYCNTALLLMILLAGCTDSKNGEAQQPSNQASAVQSDEKHTEPEESTKIRKDEAEPITESEESATKAANETSSAEEKSKEDNVLAAYSSEKIEYARVWLQLGPNQEIDELNVRHISAGEPINPNDDKCQLSRRCNPVSRFSFSGWICHLSWQWGWHDSCI